MLSAFHLHASGSPLLYCFCLRLRAPIFVLLFITLVNLQPHLLQFMFHLCHNGVCFLLLILFNSQDLEIRLKFRFLMTLGILSRLKGSQESQMRHDHLTSTGCRAYGQCHFTVRTVFYIAMSPMLGCRLSRGHLITFARSSPSNPSIQRQNSLHPLLFIGVSMVGFNGQSVLLGYNKQG